MPKPEPLAAIWLIQPDEPLTETLAEGLRRDGMTVSIVPSIAPALQALHQGGRPAVVVVAPFEGPLTDLEFIEQAKALSPRVAVFFTPSSTGVARTRSGAHILPHPLDGAKLSRFIRLVAARPALRSTLQTLYRNAQPPRAKAEAPRRTGAGAPS